VFKCVYACVCACARSHKCFVLEHVNTYHASCIVSALILYVCIFILLSTHNMHDAYIAAPHGDCFWKWAKIAEDGMNNNIQITTCHSYDINKPFKFTCTNDCCAKVYGRHSKKGIDVARQLCGVCHSSLEYSGKMNPDGTVSSRDDAAIFDSIHVVYFIHLCCVVLLGCSFAAISATLVATKG
jgi:hypothetical protein